MLHTDVWCNPFVTASAVVEACLWQHLLPCCRTGSDTQQMYEIHVILALITSAEVVVLLLCACWRLVSGVISEPCAFSILGNHLRRWKDHMDQGALHIQASVLMLTYTMPPVAATSVLQSDNNK
jgi:hypothetical protein